MNRWLVGFIVGMFACAAGFLAVTRHFVSQHQPQPTEDAVESTAATAPSPPEPPEPIVLAQVIDTADIDPLLDPPEKPITGVPFELDARTTPNSAPMPTQDVPARIPPAIEDLPNK
jgi:hypothetical protein